jgi:hypothetical protein
MSLCPRGRIAAARSDRPSGRAEGPLLRSDAGGRPVAAPAAALPASAMLVMEIASKDEGPGRLIGVEPRALGCSAPWEAALQGCYASPPRRCPVLSGRRAWGSSRSLRPTGSTTVIAAGCRCASVHSATAGTFTAPGSARSARAESRCAVRALATRDPSVAPANTLSGSGVTASGESQK